MAGGARLPSTRGLAAELGVARLTVLEAFEQLYADGYVEGRSGSGTYVVRELPSDVLRAPPDRAPDVSPAGPGRLLSRRGAILAATPMPIPTVTRPRAFVPGIPGLEDFPFDLWRRLMAKQWRRAPVDRMLYGDPAGYRPLREAIAAYLGAARGVRCDADQIVVVGCSQQALDLAARLLVDEGDAVWMEEPGLPGCARSLHRGGRAADSGAGGRRGPRRGAGRRAREGRAARLRDAVASVPAGRDDEPDAATGAARLGARQRRLGARGRLRQRVPVQRPAARRAPGPRPRTGA